MVLNKMEHLQKSYNIIFFYIEFIQQEYIEQKINIISQIGFVQHNYNIHTSILLFPTLLIVCFHTSTFSHSIFYSLFPITHSYHH